MDASTFSTLIAHQSGELAHLRALPRAHPLHRVERVVTAEPTLHLAAHTLVQIVEGTRVQDEFDDGVPV